MGGMKDFERHDPKAHLREPGSEMEYLEAFEEVFSKAMDVDAEVVSEVTEMFDFEVEVSVELRIPEDAEVSLVVPELMRLRGALISSLPMMDGGISDLLTAGDFDPRMRAALSTYGVGGRMAIEAAVASVDDWLRAGGFPTVSLYEVRSSNVAAMGWADPHAAEDLPVAVVEFTNGSVYAYEDVSEEVFHEWWAADSQGVYLNTHIKGVYEFRRLV